MSANVILTQNAARRISEIVAGEPDKPLLRVSVEGGGCSGFQYKFDLVADKAEDDTVLQRDGATVLIDPVSLGFLEGSEIDFVDELIGASFQIRNPNATAYVGRCPKCMRIWGGLFNITYQLLVVNGAALPARVGVPAK